MQAEWPAVAVGEAGLRRLAAAPLPERRTDGHLPPVLLAAGFLRDTKAVAKACFPVS